MRPHVTGVTSSSPAPQIALPPLPWFSGLIPFCLRSRFSLFAKLHSNSYVLMFLFHQTRETCVEMMGHLERPSSSHTLTLPVFSTFQHLTPLCFGLQHHHPARISEYPNNIYFSFPYAHTLTQPACTHLHTLLMSPTRPPCFVSLYLFHLPFY